MIDHREVLKKYIFYISSSMPAKESMTFFTEEERDEMNKLQDDAVRQYYKPDDPNKLEEQIAELANKREKLLESFKNA